MACDFAVLQLTTLDRSTVLVSGTYNAAQPCPSMAVTVTFPDGVQRAIAQTDNGAWSARFTLTDPTLLKSWCESADPADPVLLQIDVDCLDAAGNATCTHTESLPLHCCPTFELLSPEIGDCLPHHDGAMRLYRWRVLITWPPNYSTTITVKIDLTQEGNPYSPAHGEITASYPDNSVAIETHLRSNRSYDGTLKCDSDSLCAGHALPVSKFHVPACSCGAAPDPATFFLVTDPQGAVVNDPNDTGCVNGDTVTVKAAAGPVTWRATTDGREIAVTQVDSLTVRVPLPIDGSRVIVTATSINGDCVFPTSVSARRCPDPPPGACVPVPAGYALVVNDRAGNTIGSDGCIEVGPAIITAPDHEGPVTWKVDGVAGTAVAGTPRTLEVPLNDTNDHSVTADVGIGACLKTITRTVRKCVGIPAQTESWRISWCMVLMIAALALFFIGHVLFTVGCFVLLLWPCFIEVAVGLSVPTGGLSIFFAIVIYWIFITVAVTGFVLSVIGVILLLIWFWQCAGCIRANAPVTFCEMLKVCHWTLMIVGSFAFLADTVVYFVSAAISGFCGGLLAGPGGFFISLISLIPWAIDVGGLAVLNLAVAYFGNAIGCFNTWPPFFPIVRLPDPSSYNAPCLDKTA